MITGEQLISWGFGPDKDGALYILTPKNLYIEWIKWPGDVFQVRKDGRFLFNIIIRSHKEFISFYESITGIKLEV